MIDDLNEVYLLKGLFNEIDKEILRSNNHKREYITNIVAYIYDTFDVLEASVIADEKDGAQKSARLRLKSILNEVKP